MATLTLRQAHHLAVQRHQAGDLAAAFLMYEQILRAQPDHADTLNMLALLESQRGNLPRALDLIDRAIAIDPSQAAYRGTQGVILSRMNRLDESIAAYGAAVSLQPNLFQAYNNLGNVLRQRGMLAEAIDVYERSIAVESNQPQIYFNLGFALQEAARPQEAISCFERAETLLSANPQAAAEARLQLGLLHLQRGDFERGLHLYESRRDVLGFPVRRDFPQPLWDGSDLSGKTILLHAEQGIGDTIQFFRYVPPVCDRGAKVILLVPASLKRLMAAQNVCEVFDESDRLPTFDVQCPLGSLPHRFATRLDSIPATTPYLNAPTSLARDWNARLAQSAGTLKVGLVWSGNPRHQQNHLRSLPPAELTPLKGVEGVQFFSLQKDAPESARPDLQMIDWTSELRDFADTAALIAGLDLVIAVDTAVAHLAGALGKPTWLLLSEPAEWRWLLTREDSPWYPTMRLFRQSKPGDWATVIERVAVELRALTDSSAKE
ncbi:MAG TPA: tetratricopeptide repeat-containing glycosyltransferase family protein [Humisphaera sp.]|jgi:Tfp pilus assembly protein PilF|nr:tetratricopeptide repeat-containing glycosyltransferase family protein [Humisphaera sp.]